MSALVSLDRLSRRFGNFTAVNALTLDVQQGEVFGLVGPNGAGKSTTIKMLMSRYALRPSGERRGLADKAGPV